jgi:Secretion system C-terminal sorting domain
MTYSTKFLLGILCTLLTNSIFAQTTDTLVTIWGGKGSKDGEFNGGLNNWTTKGLASTDATKKAQAVWTWSKDGTGKGGAFWGNNSTAIPSLTPTNGAAIFNSDQLDNGGVETNIGKGVTAPHSGELVSPAINLSKEKDVVIEFYQSYRVFRGEVFNQNQRNLTATILSYSRDGGKNWRDTIVLNEDVPTNGISDKPFQRVPLKGVGGVSDFRFKFVWSGNYYYWIIDDVRVARRENNNMRVNEDFYAVAPNYGTPKSQVEPWGFMADISNIGSAAQTKVKLKGEVFEWIDPAKPSTPDNLKRIYADSLDYGTLKADSLAQNVPFKSEFTPPNTAAKLYLGSYTITSEQKDYYLDNNIILFPFAVTDSIFRKDGLGSLFAVAPGASNSYTYGNHYYMPKGKGKFGAKAEFDIRNTATQKGAPVNIWLYEWIDANKDGRVQKDERKIVGYNEYTVKGTETGLTTVPLLNFDDDKKPIQLKDATDYLLMFEYNEFNKLSLPIYCVVGYDYSAMVYRYEVLNKPSRRYAHFLDIGNKGEFTRSNFYGSPIPRLRLHISNYNPLLKTDVKDQLPTEFTTLLTPNPARDFMQLQLNMPKIAKKMEMRVIDASGKTLRMEQYDNVQSQTFEVSVVTYPAGVYYLQVITEFGNRAIPFTVVK